MTGVELRDTLQKRLYDATLKGHIRWQETADDDSFRASFKSGMVRVTKTGWDQFCLVVLNKEGYEVDRISWTEAEEKDQPNLWELARQAGRKADDVIRNILQEMDGKNG